jgi:glycine/D-amino acid oxidase-like deaminating enzyme/nitrite reductase/ring-hydroxylating ferredoxin subunit
VLEQDRLGSGTTGSTTAHLTQVFDTGLDKLVQALGTEGARAVWEAGRRAIAHLEATAEAERIACHFRRVPGYYYATSRSALRDVQDEAKRARDLGFVADVVFDRVYPPMAHGGMRVASQAQFHPRKYLLGLAERLAERGCLLFEHSHVSAVHAGEPARVDANGFVVSATHVVFATHAPIHNRLFAAKVAAYQSYAVGVRVPRGTFPYALAWDSEDPYHYWRQEPGEGFDTLIVGGEDHRTGQKAHTCNAFEKLEAYVHEQLEGVEHALTHGWSAQWWEPVDGVPFIGRVAGAPNEYIATGFSGNGMTFGPFAGLLIADLILGRPNAMAAYFDPSRLKLRAGAITFVTENIAFPAYFAKDWLTPAEAAELDELHPGEGRVVAMNGQRVAASRDEQGGVHLVSAVCTHMACQVHWNEAETTWDCPCHGSRFTPDGAVVTGPAIQPLAPVEAPKGKEAKP